MKERYRRSRGERKTVREKGEGNSGRVYRPARAGRACAGQRRGVIETENRPGLSSGICQISKPRQGDGKGEQKDAKVLSESSVLGGSSGDARENSKVRVRKAKGRLMLGYKRGVEPAKSPEDSVAGRRQRSAEGNDQPYSGYRKPAAPDGEE